MRILEANESLDEMHMMCLDGNPKEPNTRNNKMRRILFTTKGKEVDPYVAIGYVQIKAA